MLQPLELPWFDLETRRARQGDPNDVIFSRARAGNPRNLCATLAICQYAGL
jgi:hypothetical protein